VQFRKRDVALVGVHQVDVVLRRIAAEQSLHRRVLHGQPFGELPGDESVFTDLHGIGWIVRIDQFLPIRVRFTERSHLAGDGLFLHELIDTAELFIGLLQPRR
jgi:hypothetical protein